MKCIVNFSNFFGVITNFHWCFGFSSLLTLYLRSVKTLAVENTIFLLEIGVISTSLVIFVLWYWSILTQNKRFPMSPIIHVNIRSMTYFRICCANNTEITKDTVKQTFYVDRYTPVCRHTIIYSQIDLNFVTGSIFRFSKKFNDDSFRLSILLSDINID